VNNTQYSYDGLNRLTEVSFAGKSITYTYRKDSQLSKVEYPNGMTTTYGYDNVGRLTSKETKLDDGTVVAGYTYTLNKVGNIIEQTTQEPYNDMMLASEETSYNYNDGNRITKAGDISFEFDANGNTKKRGNTTYLWDCHNKLIDADNSGFIYDPLGYLATYQGDIQFTTDPMGIGNVLSDSKSGAEYIYGNGLEARVINGQASYYVTDVRGSVVAIVDDDGNITHKYQYNAFGKVTQKEEANFNPFQYVGKWGVMYMNDHLYYMRARYYDPTIGRFLSEDPIWSTNLYPYVENNPIMGIDPRGLYLEITHGDVTGYIHNNGSKGYSIIGFYQNKKYVGYYELSPSFKPDEELQGDFRKVYDDLKIAMNYKSDGKYIYDKRNNRIRNPWALGLGELSWRVKQCLLKNANNETDIDYDNHLNMIDYNYVYTPPTSADIQQSDNTEPSIFKTMYDMEYNGGAIVNYHIFK
jgi:RHS repeat-associated protein